MKIKFILFLLFPLIISFMNGCQIDDKMVKIPSEWKLREKPDTDSDEWQKANWSEDIGISLDNGSITASAEIYEKRESPNYLIPHRKLCDCTSCNGIFFGFNHGEWGGGIIFVPIESNVYPEYRVMSENFCGFYTIGDRIYVLTGLAHLMFSYGSIYELVVVGEQFEDKWEAVKTLDIEYAPETFLLVDGDLYIATSDTLILVKNGKISDILIENAGWGILYPNSMIYANNSIFIGMRGWVCEYDLETRTEKWYDFSNK